TSQRSWGEANLDSLSKGVKLEPDQGDVAGPLTIAAAVSAPVADVQPAVNTSADTPKAETRLVVFGDSDFPSNAYGGIAGNPNMFANAVNWLAQQEGLIAIRPKATDD